MIADSVVIEISRAPIFYLVKPWGSMIRAELKDKDLIADILILFKK